MFSKEELLKLKRVLSLAEYNKNFSTLVEEQNKIIKNGLNKFKRSLGVYSDFKRTTRQIDQLSRLFNISAPGVVFILSLDSKVTGSGVIINEKGQILTNWHVASNYEKMFVYLFNEEISSFEDLDNQEYYLANVKGVDHKRDLALLEFENPKNIKFKFLKLGHGRQVEIGDQVFAIGHPRNIMWTPTSGEINRIRKNYKWVYGTHQLVAKVIQTQVPINPGNSGGPMFNNKGEIIGINAFAQLQSEGLNFAIHIDEVLDFIRKVDEGIYTHEPVYSSEEEMWSKLDRNKNGIGDGFILIKDGKSILKDDSNEDGIIDIWMFDTNGDDSWNILTYDKDNDGHFEYFIIDEDFDGNPDSIGIDTNGDMIPDIDFVYNASMLK